MAGLQKSLAEAREGLREEWNRAQAAASERSAAMGRLEQARSVAAGILDELQDECSKFALTYLRVYRREFEGGPESGMLRASESPIGASCILHLWHPLYV